MIRIKGRILNDLRKERVVNTYVSKGRLIEPHIYNLLKARKKCDYCHKVFNGRVPQIHHIKPLADGGSNDVSNLMAVHKYCHKILDGDAGVGRHER